MDCPKCKNAFVEKQISEESKHTYFLCEDCGGSWLPFLATQKMLKQDFVDVVIYRHKIGQGLVCPHDGSVMTACLYSDVEIDACEECMGVWFDAEEYALILESVKKEDAKAYSREITGKAIVMYFFLGIFPDD